MWHINQYCYKMLFVVAGLLATTSSLLSQQYSIIPSDTISSNAPFNDVTHFNITQTNLSDSKLVFSWKQIYLSVPTGWIANLCDNGHCYTDFPLNGTMDTVYKGDYGLMSVGIDPGLMNGTATIRYALWEANSAGKIDTLTWIITASSSTAIIETQLNKSLFIYPNPAKDLINIQVLNDANFMLTDLSGKLFHSGMLKAGTNNIPLNRIPEGSYLISICSKEGEYFIQKLTIQY